jgi:hypothetical protein
MDNGKELRFGETGVGPFEKKLISGPNEYGSLVDLKKDTYFVSGKEKIIHIQFIIQSNKFPPK